MRRRALRATPRASCRITAIRLDPSRTYAPAALRASLSSGGKPCGYPRRAGLAPLDTPNRHAPDRPGQHPTAWAVLGGCAGARCGRLCEYVPSATLAVRCLYVMKDGSWIRSPALLGAPHRAFGMAACMDGRFPAGRWEWPCLCQGRAFDAFVRGCRAGHGSFRIGGSAQGVLGLL